MEPRDLTFENFKHFQKGLTPEYWKTIKTEADTRLKIIDPIFENVFGFGAQKETAASI